MPNSESPREELLSSSSSSNRLCRAANAPATSAAEGVFFGASVGGSVGASVGGSVGFSVTGALVVGAAVVGAAVVGAAVVGAAVVVAASVVVSPAFAVVTSVFFVEMASSVEGSALSLEPSFSQQAAREGISMAAASRTAVSLYFFMGMSSLSYFSWVLTQSYQILQ